MPEFRGLDLPERQRCMDALVCHIQKPQGIGDLNAAIKDVFAAFLEQRHGPAAGSTAFHPATKKSAVRYFDPTFDCLRWLITDDPTRSVVRAERSDGLPGSGWTISARPWQELVYR